VSHRTLGCLVELLETFLLTLVIFLVVQAFVAQPYQVQQTSMENTLLPDQYVLVDKLTPRFDDYHRGDIVVFNPPSGWAHDPSGTPFIKRVIGVGGDTVDIHAGHVYVNGVQLVEPYVFEDQTTDMPDGGSKTWILQPGQFFVMGDHRQESQDSRDFGPIDKSSIIGRAWLRYWPLSQFGPIKQVPVPTPSPAPASSGSAAPSTAP
jgi:signal peptidase I